MAFGSSGVFQEFVKNPATRAINAATAPTGYTDLLTDTVKVALFDNTVTPDKDAVVASTGYGAGTWASGGVSHANWPATGQTLLTDTYTDVANAMMYDAPDLAGAGTLTLTNAYGCLVYDDSITAGTVADQGICFNAFGGAQTVTNGTFTIVWHANGIFRFTV